MSDEKSKIIKDKFCEKLERKKYYEVYNDGEFQGYILKEELNREIESNQFKMIPNYFKLNQNNISNNINHTMNKSKMTNNNDQMIVDMMGTGVVKVGNLEYQIENFTKLKEYIGISTSKLFVYSILKMEENESRFTLADYIEFRNLKDKKTQAKKIKFDLKILKLISNINFINKKKDTQILSSIIVYAEYKRGKIIVKFNSDFAEMLKGTYMYVSENLIKLNDQKFPHTWALGYYIYEYARINKNCMFNLSIKSCLNRLTLPSYDFVNNSDREYTRRIIEPFENTIDTLMENINDLSIEYINDNETIEDFFNNSVKININNWRLKHYYKEIELENQRKSIDFNKNNKVENKRKALKLKDDGKTNTEIAEILKLTKRTIRNYFMENDSKNNKQ